MAAFPIENVSDTAFWIAHYRAIEGERSDALFRDPLAARLAGNRGRQIAATMPGAYFTSWSVVIRTCIIDDYIREAIARGTDTILNLGAGLDTRPYRMDLPANLNWVEVDYANVIEVKEQQLRDERPHCKLVRVKLDLADATTRRRKLAEINNRARKMLILTEGVIPYLTTADAGLLADDLRTLDHAAYWIVDYFSRDAIKYRQRQMAKRMQNAPFKFDPEDWYAFFESHGWRCEDMRYLAAEGERLGRRPKFPLHISLMWLLRKPFMSKEQRDSFKTLAGYGLLVPG